MRNLFMLSIFLLLTTFASHSQFISVPDLGIEDSVPVNTLIISEVQGAQASKAGFLEITNVGDDTLNLVNFFFQGRYFQRAEPYLNPTDNKASMQGIIAPGKSFIFDIPIENRFTVDEEQNPIYPGEYYSNRSLSELSDMHFISGALRFGLQFALFSRYRNPQTGLVDSVIVDVFNTNVNNSPSNLPIAGYTGRPLDKQWVRKPNVKKGNTDWNNSRGTDAIDSEWFPLNPIANEYNQLLYSTMRNHGYGDFNSIMPKGNITIDHENLKIKFPYGSAYRDSVFRSFNYGPNLGWEFIYGPVDTAEYYIQTGDTLVFYAMDDQIVKRKYVTEILPKDNSFNQIRPLILKQGKKWVKKFDISIGAPIDSVYNLVYNVRKDSLLKYVIIESDCSYEFIAKNGKVKPDLEYGDILRITAPSGAKKDYKICTLPYKKSTDSRIKTVILPGMNYFENPFTFYLTDTLHQFVSTASVINVDLPEDVDNVPPMVFIPSNRQSTIKVVKAKSITGTPEDRTTTVTVTAEDGVSQNVYQFVFKKLRNLPELDHSLFISDMGTDWGSFGNGWVLQIFNPFDYTIDFSDYFLCMGQDNGGWNQDNYLSAGGALGDPDRWVFRPGYRILQDINQEYVFNIDLVQTNFFIPSKGVYNFTHFRGWPFEGLGISKELQNKVDYRIFSNTVLPHTNQLDGEITPDSYGTRRSLFWNFTWWHAGALGKSLWLYKITNDSVKEGTKPMTDFNDYELIDVMNGWSGHKQKWLMFDNINGKDTILDAGAWQWVTCTNMYRKSDVYRGNPVDRASFGIGDPETGTVFKNSEWVDYGAEEVSPGAKTTNQNRADATSRKRFKFHEMTYNKHVPYILSNVYRVSEGITGTQTIAGIPANSTIESMMANIIKPNENMKIVVRDKSGNDKAVFQTLAADDRIYSFSERGIDSVEYKPIFGALDNNIKISSSKYTVTVQGDNKSGKVAGIPFGVSLKEILNNITVPSSAKALITDGDNGIIPLEIVPFDTLMIAKNERKDKIASNMTFIEVTAQNGDVCLYSLEFTKNAPILLSDLYNVDNELKQIDMVFLTSVKKLLENLTPQPGYKLKVVDKTGNERKDGSIYFDDRVVMFNEQNSSEAYLYFLQVFGEKEFDFNALKKNNSSSVKLFPNPTNGRVNISAKGLKNISVRDLTGRVVMKRNVSGLSASFMLPEKSGVYLISVISDEGLDTIKVIKE